MNELTAIQAPSGFDAMLPPSARHYLAHTVDGRSIREIAREAGCHASTVLRQIRKTESSRDDPLVDKALSGTSDNTEMLESVFVVHLTACGSFACRGPSLSFLWMQRSQPLFR